jgi:hypothetical protein
MDGSHTVAWNIMDGGYPDECQPWRVEGGTQKMEIESMRTAHLLLSPLFGKPVLSTYEGGKLPEVTDGLSVCTLLTYNVHFKRIC